MLLGCAITSSSISPKRAEKIRVASENSLTDQKPYRCWTGDRLRDSVLSHKSSCRPRLAWYSGGRASKFGQDAEDRVLNFSLLWAESISEDCKRLWQWQKAISFVLSILDWNVDWEDSINFGNAKNGALRLYCIHELYQLQMFSSKKSSTGLEHCRPLFHCCMTAWFGRDGMMGCSLYATLVWFLMEFLTLFPSTARTFSEGYFVCFKLSYSFLVTL